MNEKMVLPVPSATGADRFRSAPSLPMAPAKGQPQKNMMQPKLRIGTFDPMTVKIGNEAIAYVESQKVPLNSSEMSAFEMVYALHAKMVESDVMEERMRKAGVWRRYRQAMGLMDKVLLKLIMTLPLKSQRHMENVRTGYEVQIKPKPVIGRTHCDQVIAIKDLEVLCLAAMDSRCRVCLNSERESKNCDLRGILMNYAPMHEWDTDSGGLCEYANAKVVGRDGEPE